MHWIALGLVGLALGALGTLIGAGGGFLLMPILVLLYPHDSPETLAAISLAVVFLNALSGSIGYARLRLIDYRAGRVFLLAAVPGALAGSLVTGRIPRREFDLALGAALVGIAAFILIAGALHPARPKRGADAPRPHSRRSLVKGAAISFVVGFVSTLLGIGGGIIHVPAMVYLLGFPVHAATATSHFVLAGTSLAGTAVHGATGALAPGLGRTVCLGVGAVIGAQIGARFALRTPPAWILRTLGVALALVGGRVILLALRI